MVGIALSRGKVIGREEMALRRRRIAIEGKTLVFTNGCFDILHAGHVGYLQQARDLGDYLAVGLNSDASTRRIKGPQRPLVPQEERALVVAALECVDFVIVFDEDTAEALVAELRPDVYVKGGDYVSDADLPEAAVVRGYGGRVEILPLVAVRSTSAIIKSILERYRDW